MSNVEVGYQILASRPTEKEIRGALMLISMAPTRKEQDELTIAEWREQRRSA